MECNKLEFVELSKEILGKGSCLRFQAKGDSMRPFIKNGQIIQVRPAKIFEINSGDVIFCRSFNNRMIVHRVIRKQRRNDKIVLLTKGDSTSDFDEYVYPDSILGKVIAIERNNRVIRMDKGMLRVINILCVKLSPFSKWICFLPRKFKHQIYDKMRNRYAD